MAGKEEATVPLGEGESSVEVTLDEAPVQKVETPKEPEGSKVAPKETDEEESPKREASEDDELAQYSEGVKKRINKLTWKQRETERQLNEALEITKRILSENEELKRIRVRSDKQAVLEAENRVKTQTAQAKDRLRIAIETNDVEKQVELQQILGNLAVEEDRIRYYKGQVEGAERRFQQPQQTQQQPQNLPRPDPEAEEWASKNEWFGQDQPMTVAAFSIHQSLVENEGVVPNSKEYYEEIDRRMRAAFPHRFKEESPSQPARQQAVAGARTTSTAAAKPGKRSITLSPSQVAIAKKLGISPEDYARHYQKLHG